MVDIALILLPILLLCILLLAFGTGVRISQGTISFGFRKYAIAPTTTFVLTKFTMRPRRSITYRWYVKVEAFENSQYIRTHLLSVSNEAAADKLIAKIQAAPSINAPLNYTAPK